MYGMPTEQLNCCASSSETWFFSNKETNSLNYFVHIVKGGGDFPLNLPDVDALNLIYCPRAALEIHLDLWRVEFVSEIY